MFTAFYREAETIDFGEYSIMETKQETTEPQTEYNPSDHPWLEVEGNVDEDLRYSLDEIRFA